MSLQTNLQGLPSTLLVLDVIYFEASEVTGELIGLGASLKAMASSWQNVHVVDTSGEVRILRRWGFLVSCETFHMAA